MGVLGKISSKRVSIGVPPAVFEAPNGRIVEGEEFMLFLSQTVGERLKDVREALNVIYPREYTIQRVKEKTGIAYPTIQKIEDDPIRFPRNDTVELLTKHYNVPELIFKEGLSSED